jgi:Flp pilus assembly protein CpaB
MEFRPEQTVANVLNRGDHVRVFATFAEKSGARASVALLPDVEVLAVSSNSDPEQQASTNQLITMAVTPDDAAKLALFGQDTGSLWLNLLPPDSPKDQVPAPFTDTDLMALAKKG